MIKALDVAKYILFLANQLGDNITSIRIQKELFFIYGEFLSINNKKLFNEKILAWEHGPVIKEVYNNYRNFELCDIITDIPCLDDIKYIDDKILEFIKLSFLTHRKYKDCEIVGKSHDANGPWAKTKKNEIIDDSIIKSYFDNKLLKYDTILVSNTEFKRILDRLNKSNKNKSILLDIINNTPKLYKLS